MFPPMPLITCTGHPIHLPPRGILLEDGPEQERRRARPVPRCGPFGANLRGGRRVSLRRPGTPPLWSDGSPGRRGAGRCQSAPPLKKNEDLKSAMSRWRLLHRESRNLSSTPAVMRSRSKDTQETPRTHRTLIAHGYGVHGETSFKGSGLQTLVLQMTASLLAAFRPDSGVLQVVPRALRTPEGRRNPDPRLPPERGKPPRGGPKGAPRRVSGEARGA